MIITNVYMVWVFIFILSILFLIRIGWNLRQAVKKDEKFLLSTKHLITLWIATAYFISYIIWLI